MFDLEPEKGDLIRIHKGWRHFLSLGNPNSFGIYTGKILMTNQPYHLRQWSFFSFDLGRILWLYRSDFDISPNKRT